MGYSVLFFLLILTQTTSLHHHCNSDVYSSASGMADLQQLTTLQYFFIDNCTIIRNDTGQQLDIVYTTQSHLVVTPTDGQTSTMVIPKNDPKLFCSIPSNTSGSNIVQIVGIVILIILVTVSGYIALVHMMFKQLRTTFGKLMMFYNIFVVCQGTNALVLSITRHNITVNSTMLCYLFNLLFMQWAVVGEAFATSCLAYLAYVMRYSYKSREVTKELNKTLYRYAITYVLGVILMYDIFIVGYDFGTGTYKHALQPNGHCSFFVQSEYDTIALFHALGYVNQIVQALLLTTYFVYYYKLNKKLQFIRQLASNNSHHNRLFLKVAIAMGATLGISQVFFIASWYIDNEIPIRIAGFFFIVQQFVIMLLFMCSKKTSRLCKERFCTTETSS